MPRAEQAGVWATFRQVLPMETHLSIAVQIQHLGEGPWRGKSVLWGIGRGLSCAKQELRGRRPRQGVLLLCLGQPRGHRRPLRRLGCGHVGETSRHWAKGMQGRGYGLGGRSGQGRWKVVCGGAWLSSCNGGGILPILMTWDP